MVRKSKRIVSLLMAILILVVCFITSNEAHATNRTNTRISSDAVLQMDSNLIISQFSLTGGTQ